MMPANLRATCCSDTLRSGTRQDRRGSSQISQASGAAAGVPLFLRASGVASSPSTARQLDLPEAMPPATPEQQAPGPAKGRPTGIQATQVLEHGLHFGAWYMHSFSSAGGDLDGVRVTEKVTNKKDDFETKLPDLEIGKITTVINKLGQIKDKIWISYGAIAPAVNRLKEKKKESSSMLLGEKVDYQELYYWDEKKPAGWKKFAALEIKQQLYDLPGLVVLTIDNHKPADMERFTPFAPPKKKR